MSKIQITVEAETPEQLGALLAGLAERFGHAKDEKASAGPRGSSGAPESAVVPVGASKDGGGARAGHGDDAGAEAVASTSAAAALVADEAQREDAGARGGEVAGSRGGGHAGGGISEKRPVEDRSEIAAESFVNVKTMRQLVQALSRAGLGNDRAAIVAVCMKYKSDGAVPLLGMVDVEDIESRVNDTCDALGI